MKSLFWVNYNFGALLGINKYKQEHKKILKR